MSYSDDDIIKTTGLDWAKVNAMIWGISREWVRSGPRQGLCYLIMTRIMEEKQLVQNIEMVGEIKKNELGIPGWLLWLQTERFKPMAIRIYIHIV